MSDIDPKYLAAIGRIDKLRSEIRQLEDNCQNMGYLLDSEKSAFEDELRRSKDISDEKMFEIELQTDRRLDSELELMQHHRYGVKHLIRTFVIMTDRKAANAASVHVQEELHSNTIIDIVQNCELRLHQYVSDEVENRARILTKYYEDELNKALSEDASKCEMDMKELLKKHNQRLMKLDSR